MAACHATVFLPSSHLRILSRASECHKRTFGHAAKLRSQYGSGFFGTKSTKRSVKERVWLGGDQGGHGDFNEDAIAEDFYSVLGLTPDATPLEIKRAYYSCMKTCHPDLSGNNPASTDFCMFVNEIYEVLSDPEQRIVYDEINGFAPTSANPFLTTTQERDHAFVDEFSCIGCKNCALIAPDTFEIEEGFGRARVHCQSGCAPRAQEAIDTCPVDCIHWVTAAQLTLLEDEMRRIERVNVAMMMSGMGFRSPNVFVQSSSIILHQLPKEVFGGIKPYLVPEFGFTSPKGLHHLGPMKPCSGKLEMGEATISGIESCTDSDDEGEGQRRPWSILARVDRLRRRRRFQARWIGSKRACSEDSGSFSAMARVFKTERKPPEERRDINFPVRSSRGEEEEEDCCEVT